MNDKTTDYRTMLLSLIGSLTICEHMGEMGINTLYDTGLID